MSSSFWIQFCHSRRCLVTVQDRTKASLQECNHSPPNVKRPAAARIHTAPPACISYLQSTYKRHAQKCACSGKSHFHLSVQNDKVRIGTRYLFLVRTRSLNPVLNRYRPSTQGLSAKSWSTYFSSKGTATTALTWDKACKIVKY